MSDFLYLFIAGAVGVLPGLLAGYLIRKNVGKRAVASAEAQAARTLENAKQKTRELVLQSKDKAFSIIEEAKATEEKRRKELLGKEDRLEQRAAKFDQKILDLESRQTELEDSRKKNEEVRKELGDIRAEQIEKLEKIAGLSHEDAKKVLLEYVEKNAEEDLVHRMRKLEATSQDELERRAKDMLTTVIQRCAASHAVDVTTTTVDIPSDEMKGRIIGKEGRNIKALEQLTGVEIIVDDSPKMITVSGFSSIRRQVAKRALEKLVLDGRIHPARIEAVVLEAKQDLTLDIKKAGENALYDLGITGIDPKLVIILGRLKYRTSFGQNVLQHSMEVAHLARLLAEELGQDPIAAKKGGLFHDIGKAVDHEVQGTHTELGYAILKKFNITEEVAYPALSHHDDSPNSLVAQIVKAADAISAARPGARKDTLEQYIQRLSDIENVANAFAGVDKSYAIQAGREVRVFVSPENIDDLAAHQLARDIAKKIEAELQYPGEIKVKPAPLNTRASTSLI
jgi:ribonucrease Y